MKIHVRAFLMGFYQKKSNRVLFIENSLYICTTLKLKVFAYMTMYYYPLTMYLSMLDDRMPVLMMMPPLG